MILLFFTVSILIQLYIYCIKILTVKKRLFNTILLTTEKRPYLFVVFSKRSENVVFSFFLHKTTKRYSYRKVFAALSIILRLQKRGTEFLGNDHHRHQHHHHHHHHHHHYHFIYLFLFVYFFCRRP